MYTDVSANYPQPGYAVSQSGARGRPGRLGRSPRVCQSS